MNGGIFGLLASGLSRLPWVAIVLVTALAAFGVAMVYSSGQHNPTTEDLWILQGQRFLFLLPLAVAVALLPPFLWRLAPIIAWPVGVVLLVAVDIMGSTRGGAESWLEYGPLRLQPSEVMKLAVVLAVSVYYAKIESRNKDRTSNELWHVPALLLILIPTAMVFNQPDLGTGSMILFAGVMIVFLSGVRWRMIIAGGVAGLLALPFAYFFILKDYQQQRIMTFIDPSLDPLGSGYHVQQSAIAIGSGGVVGKGWLQGTQAQNQFIPEQHTDFIFSVSAEEWGLLGSLMLLGVYMALLAWGWGVATRANNTFHRLAAAGATVTIAFYVFVNLGMVMGILPVVGVPLPLVSHGGSSMFTVLMCFSLLVHTHMYATDQGR
jgi:rod shape determining protein RodA